MIATIAAQQIVSLRRQRVFVALLCTLMVMTTLAGLLGWSSHQTIVRVYDEAVRLLASTGRPAPPNPFLLKPALSLLSNMVVYIPLLGALLALVLGHLAVADDETGGIARLVFTRPLRRSDYVLGKIVGAAVALAAVLAASLIVSTVSLIVANRAVPAGADLGRLALFYALSWMYLMAFALIGMVAMLVSRSRSLGLLTAIGVWLVLTFAVPQVTSGLRPTASLNPITDPVSTSQTFFKITANARPFSVVEQFKAASAQILQTVAAEPAGRTALRALPLGGLVLILAAVAAHLVQRHDFSRSATDG